MMAQANDSSDNESFRSTRAIWQDIDSADEEMSITNFHVDGDHNENANDNGGAHPGMVHRVSFATFLDLCLTTTTFGITVASLNMLYASLNLIFLPIIALICSHISLLLGVYSLSYGDHFGEGGVWRPRLVFELIDGFFTLLNFIGCACAVGYLWYNVSHKSDKPISIIAVVVGGLTLIIKFYRMLRTRQLEHLQNNAV